MAKDSRYLFVYGTLRKDAGCEMYYLLASNAVFVGEATVRGTLYSLGDYPGLVPNRHAPDVVKGELYLIGSGALRSTLAILDIYEGLGPNQPWPHQYRRMLVTATADDGCELEAWAYVVDRPLEGLRRINSGDFTAWRRSKGADRRIR